MKIHIISTDSWGIIICKSSNYWRKKKNITEYFQVCHRNKILQEARQIGSMFEIVHIQDVGNWKEYSQYNQWPWKHTVHHGILCYCIYGLSSGKWNLYWYFWDVEISECRKCSIANCLNEMQTYWGYEVATPANCCHISIELLGQRLCREGSVLLVMPYYTSELLLLDVSCNKPLKSVIREQWNKWVKDG